MPRAPDIGALACEMKAAQDEARQVEPFTSRVPGFDLATAYEVAHAIHAARLGEGALPGLSVRFAD